MPEMMTAVSFRTMNALHRAPPSVDRPRKTIWSELSEVITARLRVYITIFSVPCRSAPGVSLGLSLTGVATIANPTTIVRWQLIIGRDYHTPHRRQLAGISFTVRPFGHDSRTFSPFLVHCSRCHSRSMVRYGHKRIGIHDRG